MCYTGCCPYEVRTGWNDTSCRKPSGEPCWLKTPEHDEDEYDEDDED